MGLFDKAKNLAGKHADKLEGAVEKVGDTIDDKTGGKFSDKIDKVQDAATSALHKGDDKA